MSRRMFVYELPYGVRINLCRLLDTIDMWEELGGEHMGFDYTYLQYIRRKPSPTDELLTSWGNQNHTVKELFVLLSKMQFYRAMILLKDHVDERYHHLLREGEELMSQPLADKTAVEPRGTVQRQNGTDQPAVLYTPSPATASPPVVSPPNTFGDSKDLGLNMDNLNLVERSPANKATRKAVHEVKIQNVPNARVLQNVDQNFNVQNNISNGQYQAAYNQNLSPHLENTGSQRPGQQRKLSNVSVTSSVMEGCTPQISYEELETATNSWDTACILGRGGFGTVYKGIWKNTKVAIKKMESPKDQQMETSELNANQMSEALRELRHLNSHRHDNILSLYGYSVTENASCLVYQYMANGSLEDRLLCRHKTDPLSWAQRLNIMTGTARGIQFLHSLGEKPLVHGDIKSANILLDSNFEPRLGDFGLAREGPHQQYTHMKVSRVHGTKPYLPDEFLRGRQFSVRVDTYSFGVVLFEVATGLRAYDDNRKDKFLKDHIVKYEGDLSSLADPLAGQDLGMSAAGLLTLGRNCVVTVPKSRPDMKTVLSDVEMLYNNYKSAERITRLARQGSLTPTSPMGMQAVLDEMQKASSQRRDVFTVSPQLSMQPPSMPFPFLINNNGQQQIVIPHRLPIDAQHLPQGVGAVQLIPGSPIIIQPPPTLTVQPPSATPSVSTSPLPPQVMYSPPPEPLDSVDIPLLTVLGIKSDALDVEQSPVLPALSVDQEVLTESSVQSSCAESTLSSRLSDFSVSLPEESQSAYLPRIPDLLNP